MLRRESYRDEHGRAQKRTLANLSKLPGDVIDGLKALLKGGTVIGAGADELQIERSLPNGHVAAALSTIRKIALDRLILSTAKDPASQRHCDLVIAMMVDRLIAPRSKLGFVRSVDQESAISSLGAVLSLGKVKEREAYEALDWLLERQTRIENGLAQLGLQDGVLVLYDVTSSYFEGAVARWRATVTAAIIGVTGRRSCMGCSARARGCQLLWRCSTAIWPIPRHCGPKRRR